MGARLWKKRLEAWKRLRWREVRWREPLPHPNPLPLSGLGQGSPLGKPRQEPVCKDPKMFSESSGVEAGTTSEDGQVLSSLLLPTTAFLQKKKNVPFLPG